MSADVQKTQKTTQRCIVQSDDAHMFPWVLKNRSLSTQTKPDPVLTQVSRRLINTAPRSLITSRLFTLVRLDGKHHAFIHFFTSLTWLQWQCEDFLCSSVSMPDPTAENKQVLMWEWEDRGRTSAVFLNRAAETEPKATSLHPVKR